MLETAIMMNPDNPAHGYNALHVEVSKGLDEALALPIKALQDGMGNAGLMEVDDEQGNKKTSATQIMRNSTGIVDKIGNGITDEENARAEQLRNEIEPKLLEAFDDRDYAIWVTEDKADSLKTPAPHNDNTVVVFGGQEMAMAIRPQEIGQLVSDEERQQLKQSGKNFIAKLRSDDVNKGEHIILSQQPALLKELGYGEAAITITKGLALNTMKEEGKGKHAHGLTEKILEQLPLAINEPLMVFKSYQNIIVIVTEVTDNNGNNIFVPVQLNKEVTTRETVNSITSIYGKKNFEKFYQKEKGNLVYVNTKKSLATTPEWLQLPKGIVEQSSFIESSISKLKSSVNNNGNTMDMLNQRAWHGSPYDFETFDLGAIGSVEGAQAHGWGLYFAGSREVSQRYKEVLASGKSDIKIMFGDKQLPAFGFVDGLTEAENKAYKAIQSVGYEKEKAIALLRDIGEKEAADIVENAEVNYRENKGKLFEVEIPDDDVLLDEQKKFEEQPEKVKKAVLEILYPMYLLEETEKNKFLVDDYKEGYNQYDKMEKLILSDVENLEKAIKDMRMGTEGEKILNLIKAGSKAQAIVEIRRKKSFELASQKKYEKVVKKEDLVKDISNMTGQELYEMIDATPKIASEKLNAAGVKGISYEGGRDGHCFVIFDDKAIDVIEKYNQQVRQQQIKGQTSLQANGKRIVSILEIADESTFMHEMAHVFLYDLQDLAQIDDASASKELELVNEWAECIPPYRRLRR